MKNKILFSSGAGLIALLFAIPLALAQGPGGPDGKRGFGDRGARFEKMAEELGLDAKQQASLKTLHETHRAEATSLHEQMKVAKDNLKSAWLAPNATKASVLAAQREVQALQAQLAEQRVDFGFAAKRVLTVDQFETFSKRFLDGPGFGKRGKHGGQGWQGKGKGEGKEWGGKRGRGQRAGPGTE